MVPEIDEERSVRVRKDEDTAIPREGPGRLQETAAGRLHEKLSLPVRRLLRS
jgi:hypothetical protein